MDTKPGQPRPTGDRKRTRTVTALTAKALDALEQSQPTEMVLRLAKTVREAWRERDEAVGSLAIERAEWEAAQRKPEGAQEAYDGREKVLVIVEPDGFVSVFAESWVDVRLIEVKPWDIEEIDERIPECYRLLFLPGKLRAHGMTWRRIEPIEQAVGVARNTEVRLEQTALIREFIDQLKAREIDG